MHVRYRGVPALALSTRYSPIYHAHVVSTHRSNFAVVCNKPSNLTDYNVQQIITRVRTFRRISSFFLNNLNLIDYHNEKIMNVFFCKLCSYVAGSNMSIIQYNLWLSVVNLIHSYSLVYLFMRAFTNTYRVGHY